MVKNKRTKVKISKDQNQTVINSLIWIIIGLLMALGGFVWATYVDDYKNVNSSSVGSSLLATTGLIVAVSALLIIAVTVVMTQVKTKKRRK